MTEPGKHDRDPFAWTTFYEAVADKLLGYRNNRVDLVARLQEKSKVIDGLAYLNGDQFPDGSTGFVQDICPFTVMGIFNRRMRDSNRTIIAESLASSLGVEHAAPTTFDAVPLLDPRRSWFFPYAKVREPGHIDALWDVFTAAIKYADSGAQSSSIEFAQTFDAASGRPIVGWNLTLGLYWIRPRSFLSLDGFSRDFIVKKLDIPIGLHGPERRCSAADYLAVMDALKLQFEESDFPVHSYPELSLVSWGWTPSVDPVEPHKPTDETSDSSTEHRNSQRPLLHYTVDSILADGCFLERMAIESLLERLRTKKSLILQGPPGTGKTWLARRLAFALMGQKDDSRVRAVQFHPNLSYEDFVRGWRPAGDGKLSLADGVFMQAIKTALAEPTAQIVVVIEEINRGNPAQIFGELLTLLEADKRTPDDALELCYADANGVNRSVYIPENLYVIGTMNIADRSLALVDLALRRRFAFVELEPRLGSVWRDWVVKERNVDPRSVAEIERRVSALNEQIAADPRLGKQFRIGHSYVTPTHRLEAGETEPWFRQVVETEIGPLLDEYWFDAHNEAQQARERLIEGWR
jgi:5-methylcytosine-specific restriction enzyme B